MSTLEAAAVFSIYLTLAAIAQAGSYLLRYDLTLPAAKIPVLLLAIPLALVTKGLVFAIMRLHRSRWQMAGTADLFSLFQANLIASALFTAAGLVLLSPNVVRSIYVLDFLLCFLLIAGARFSVRLISESVHSIQNAAGRSRILIYGAGSAGVTLLREIRSNSSLRLQVAGFIDDDPRKAKAVILGAKVLGTGRDVPRIVQKASLLGRGIHEIVIAMPSASGRAVREALANCRAAGVACKTVPSLGELLAGKVLSAQMRTINITDLLGREPVQLDECLIRARLSGRSVLVTGGAGSIGSELCRQITKLDPECLVILDQAESDLFRIELELRQRHPKLKIVARIGDIRDEATVMETLRRYSISVVFHAAAYKHVPMMEVNLVEALANNVVGTWNVARAAKRHGVTTFLMISTDKAVRPTNIMGATKRAAEQVVRSIGKTASFGSYVSVRFGNVLGSNGSVVPLFQQQIAAGGPVTVTHPEMRRFFMTIPEAVQLVLQASAMGQGAEIFVLNMGEPVRIVDLARNMIKLAGFEPDKDIEIRFVGPRPGEKLYEELMLEGEHILPTFHEKIKIFRAMDVESSFVDLWMRELLPLLERRQESALIDHIKRLVPEYEPSKTASPTPLVETSPAVQVAHA